MGIYIRLLLLILPFYGLAQQSVQGTFSPPGKHNWGIVYQLLPTGSKYAVDAKIDTTGSFRIKMGENAAPGMYRLVYAVPPENHNLEFIYSGKESITFKFDEKTGVNFTSSQENVLWQNYLKEMERLDEEILRYYNLEGHTSEGILSLFDTGRKLQEAFKNSANGLTASHFIQAHSPYFPTEALTKQQFLDVRRKGMFDRMNVNDTVLQHSRYFLGRMKSYVQDTTDLDRIAAFLKPSDIQYQKINLLHLFQHFEKKERQDWTTYIASNYLIPVAAEAEDQAMVDVLERYVNLSIGSKAPDFNWEENGAPRSLHNVNEAENYVLVFWSSECSHCLHELPKLHKKMGELPDKEWKVIAFGLEDDIYNWRNESLRLPRFMHVPGLGKWENTTGKAYNIRKTPTFFVLNGNKEIVAKPNDLEELMTYFNSQ